MPDLPEDVLFLIVKELQLLHRREHPNKASQWSPTTRLAQYAGVGRAWNAIIERETFKHLHVFSEDLHGRPHSITPARFKQMMDRDPARRHATLRRISFCASHPGSNQSEDDEGFSQSIRKFWKVLETLEAPDGKPRNLFIHTASITHRDAADFVPGENTYLHLVGHPLPQLRCFTGFYSYNSDCIWPSSLMRMAGSMIGLIRTNLFFDDDMNDPKLRRRYREDVAESISQIPAGCLELKAKFTDYSYGFDELPAVEPFSPDILCISLRSLSMRLRHLRLENLRVSPVLFWPATDEQTPSTPSWPHLETLDLILAPLDSYGRYYADPDAEELEFNANHPHWRPIERIIRAVPRPERGLHQLIAAAGRAVRSGMPRLERLHMEHDRAAPEMELHFGRDWTGHLKGSFRLSWQTSPAVPLSEEVLEAWGLRSEECEVYEGEHECTGPYYWMEAVVPWR